MQGDDPFWSNKLPQEKSDKPERPTRPKTIVLKKPAHKRKSTTSSDPPADDDVGNSDLEVELDSLGLLFIHLIDDDICQDDAEASHADDAEVITQDTLKRLSMLPARIEELKKSAARTGAINALIRAKASVPDFDPVEAAQGYPSLKEDGSEFNEEDLRAINRAVRPLACQLTEEADLSHYQAQYNDQNKRVAAPIPEAENLIPPIRKHTYAPDIGPSSLIHEEAVFQALMGIDWTTVDFQPLGRDEEAEAAQDDPQQSNRGGEQA